MAGIAVQWSKVFLNLIFSAFIVRKGFQISMKISRGDSSQSIERSSSELLMKFDSSKLERLGDGAGSGFPQPSCLLQMRHWVKCLNLGSA